MPVKLERTIFGKGKDINFSKFNMGSLIKAVTYDLEEFGEKGVQGVKILEGDVNRLTSRERQVFDLVAEGLSNKAIAERLGLSNRTVEGHVNQIFLKLGVESRTELVRLAVTRA